jgi:hypothetical protein
MPVQVRPFVPEKEYVNDVIAPERIVKMTSIDRPSLEVPLPAQ